VYLAQSHIDEAIRWLEKARIAAPELPWVHLRLASVYGLKGETERAAVELAEARRTDHHGHDLSISRVKGGFWPLTKIDALLETTYYTGLRKAGVPAEQPSPVGVVRHVESRVD
jgi:hypothetical protein